MFTNILSSKLPNKLNKLLINQICSHCISKAGVRMRADPTFYSVLGAIEQNRRLFCVVKNQATGRGGKIEFGTGISNPCVPSCSCIQNYDQTVSRSFVLYSSKKSLFSPTSKVIAMCNL